MSGLGLNGLDQYSSRGFFFLGARCLYAHFFNLVSCSSFIDTSCQAVILSVNSDVWTELWSLSLLQEEAALNQIVMEVVRMFSMIDP